MRIYLPWHPIPELRDLGRDQQKEAWRACVYRPYLQPRGWVTLIKPGVLVLTTLIPMWIAGGYMIATLYEDSPITATAMAFILASASGIFGAITIVHTLVKQTRPFLREFVSDRYGSEPSAAPGD